MRSVADFNAAYHEWVPVVADDGDKLLSLRDVLVESHSLRGLSVEPLVFPGLVRLLVAVVLRTHGVRHSADVEQLWQQGQFDPGAIDDYLAQHEQRFEVFSQEHPFLQVADLDTSAGAKPVTALRLSAATGNNVPLFSAYTEGHRPLMSVSEALCGALAVISYDPAGLKGAAIGDEQGKGGKTSGNQTGLLGKMGAVLPLGQSLFHTLVLNLPVGRIREGDRPLWERDLGPNWEVRQPDGILDLLTFPSRRIRLVPTEDHTAIQAVVVTAGDRLHFVPRDLEPHCRWRQAKVPRGVEWLPMRWTGGSPAWRGLDSTLALHQIESQTTSTLLHQLQDVSEWLDTSYPLRLACVGATYGTMSAVIEDVYWDEVPLPLAALRASQGADLREALTEVVHRSEKVRRALNDLATNLKLLQGGAKQDWDKGSHPGNDAMALLTAPTHRFLLGLQREPGRYIEGLRAWDTSAHELAWSVANPLLDQALPSAFEGRTVRSGASERIIRLADAEAWFRAELLKSLTHLDTDRSQGRTP